MFSNNTLICINPDKTLSAFLSKYHSDTNRSQTQYPINNTVVCMNPDTVMWESKDSYQTDLYFGFNGTR